MAGKNEWEELQCDVLVDTLGDLQASRLTTHVHTYSNYTTCLFSGVTQAMKEVDPIKREELRARLTKEELPFYLSKFETIVKDNGGFSVGDDV